MNAKRIAVVGSGNIAKRHIGNIAANWPNYHITVIHPTGRLANAEEYSPEIDVGSFSLVGQNAFDWAIIASPSAYHVQHADYLLAKGVPVLLEKPIAHQITDELLRLDAQKHRIRVAYNLRFLSSAQFVKNWLQHHKLGAIHSVIVDVGQFLPDWRPNKDYRETASARSDLGGGVLLELSHELDYLQWLFGHFVGCFCNARRSGVLELDVEDTADLLLQHSSGWVANVHLDMLQRKPFRVCKIVFERGVLSWNIIKNTVCLSEGNAPDVVVFDGQDWDRNLMYKNMLVAYQDTMAGAAREVCTFEEALAILNLVVSLKSSSEEARWVSLV